MVADISEYLSQCSWRGLSFPIQVVSEKGSQSLTIHRFMDRDGAQVEATGRAPDSFTVRAYFINGLTAGPNEDWSTKEALFPNTWVKVRAALRDDRSSGPLNHPLYGTINCKPVAWNMVIEATSRGGCVVDIEFIETVDTSGQAVQQSSVISEATTAAGDLDIILGQMEPPPVYDTGDHNSYLGLIQSICAIVDQVELIGMQIKGKIDKAINSLNQLAMKFGADSNIIAVPYDTTSSVPASGVPLGNSAALALDAINRLLAALYILRDQFNAQRRDVQLLTVYQPTTLAGLIPVTGNSLTDLLSLNPDLAAFPFILPYTIVRYYA